MIQTFGLPLYNGSTNKLLGVNLDREHTIARNLLFLQCFNEFKTGSAGLDLVKGMRSKTFANLRCAIADNGGFSSFDGASTSYLGLTSGPWTVWTTVAAQTIPASASGNNNICLRWNFTTGATGWIWFYNADSATGNTQTFEFVSGNNSGIVADNTGVHPVVNNLYSLFATSNGINQRKNYVNGRLTNTLSNQVNPVAMGGTADFFSNGAGSNFPSIMTGIWNRQLTQDEIRELTANPYCLLQKPLYRTWFFPQAVYSFNAPGDSAASFVGQSTASSSYTLTPDSSASFLAGSQFQMQADSFANFGELLSDFTLSATSDLAAFAGNQFAMPGESSASFLGGWGTNFSLQGNSIFGSGTGNSFGISGTSSLAADGAQAGQVATFDADSDASFLAGTSFDMIGESDLEFIAYAPCDFDMEGEALYFPNGITTAETSFDIEGNSQLNPFGIDAFPANFSMAGDSSASFIEAVVTYASFAMIGEASYASQPGSQFEIGGSSSASFNAVERFNGAFSGQGNSSWEGIAGVEFHLQETSDLSTGGHIPKSSKFTANGDSQFIAHMAKEFHFVMAATSQFGTFSNPKISSSANFDATSELTGRTGTFFEMAGDSTASFDSGEKFNISGNSSASFAAGNAFKIAGDSSASFFRGESFHMIGEAFFGAFATSNGVGDFSMDATSSFLAKSGEVFEIVGDSDASFLAGSGFEMDAEATFNGVAGASHFSMDAEAYFNGLAGTSFNMPADSELDAVAMYSVPVTFEMDGTSEWSGAALGVDGAEKFTRYNPANTFTKDVPGNVFTRNLTANVFD